MGRFGLLGGGEDELHSLAEEMKDELQKEEHEVELTEGIIQDLSDALQAYEDIKPDIDVLMDLERIDVESMAGNDGTLSPVKFIQQANETEEKVQKMERDLPQIEEEAARIERDLKDVVSKLKEKDDLFNKVEREEADIEGKIATIENEQLPTLEDAVKRAEQLQ